MNGGAGMANSRRVSSLPFLLGAETASARFAAGAYGFWRAHVRALLAEGVPEPAQLADIALTPLAPELYQRQRDVLGLTPEQIGDQLAWLAGRILASGAGDV